MTEQTISLERLEDTINLFGSFDENIRLIEHELGVSVISRDSQLKVSGEDPEQVLFAVHAIENLMGLAARGEAIGEQNVRYVLQLVREGPGAGGAAAVGRRAVHHGQGKTHQGQDPGPEEVCGGHPEEHDHPGHRPCRYR